jgi:DNA-binding transcriptional regulator of glucitol operon
MPVDSVKWLSRRSLKLHTTVVLVVAACLALGWWQLERALSGNTLSWVYTFEWPFFAGYAVFLWWRLLHEEPGGQPFTKVMSLRSGSRAEHKAQAKRQRQEQDDQKLAQYNQYLAELNASDRSTGR